MALPLWWWLENSDGLNTALRYDFRHRIKIRHLVAVVEGEKMKIPVRITISKFDRRSWRNGKLHEKLAAKYPMLFDVDDLRLARNQFASGSHFTEWLAAIEIYKRTGFKSLVEKYEFAGHPEKSKVLKALGINIQRFKHCQYPDLLVYDQSGNWEFVEVKSKKDKLSENQVKHFPEIERLFGKKIKILRLIEI